MSTPVDNILFVSFDDGLALAVQMVIDVKTSYGFRVTHVEVVMQDSEGAAVGISIDAIVKALGIEDKIDSVVKIALGDEAPKIVEMVKKFESENDHNETRH